MSKKVQLSANIGHTLLVEPDANVQAFVILVAMWSELNTALQGMNQPAASASEIAFLYANKVPPLCRVHDLMKRRSIN